MALGSPEFEPRRNHYPSEAAVLAVVADFDARFPTDKDCWEEVYRRGSEEGVWNCHHCGHDEFEREYGARVAACTGCNKKSWLTAGTFFNRMRRAKPWLLFIWLIEQGMVLSSARFHRLVGMAQSSALHIFKKVTTVMHHEVSNSACELPSADFVVLFCKRSRETPARLHPRAEEFELDAHSAIGEVHVSPDADEPSGNACLNDDELSIYNCLSDEPLHIDSLSQLTGLSIVTVSTSLTMLVLARVVVRHFGDFYTRSLPYETGGLTAKKDDGYEGEMEATVMSCVEFVRRCFHGISRKYLQNYLSVYCYQAGQAWLTDRTLLGACLCFGPLTYKQILKYVTPTKVKLALVP